MEFIRRYIKEVVLGLLILSNLLVWSAVQAEASAKTLKVYFLDVGQGDAIFIETPNKHQILIDGGKNRKILSELGSVMSFGDKSIDIVMATHPDADHIGGLPEVVERYDVELFLEPGSNEANELNEELHSRISNRDVVTLLARRGQIIDFGDGVILSILFPNGDVSNLDTNDASIVARLEYGEKSFLLTGDAGIRTESILLTFSKEEIDVDVLKAGHHGSRTSTSLPFAERVTPEFAIISAGKDNSYGHPHQEVLKILEKVGAKIISTIEEGAIRMETDGEKLEVK